MDDSGYFLLVHLDSDLDGACLIRVMVRYWPETDQHAMRAHARRRMRYAVHAAHLRALSRGEIVKRIIWDDGDTTQILHPADLGLEGDFVHTYRQELQAGSLLLFLRGRR